MASLANGLVERAVLLCLGRRLEFGLDHQSRPYPHASSGFVIFGQPLDQLGQVGFTTQLGNQSRYSIANIFGNSTGVEADHWSATRHRLQANLGLIVFPGWDDDEIRSRINQYLFGNRVEVAELVQLWQFGRRLDFSRSKQQAFDLGTADAIRLTQSFQRRQQMLNTFATIADLFCAKTDQHRVRLDPQLFSCELFVDRMKLLEIQAVRDRLESRIVWPDRAPLSELAQPTAGCDDVNLFAGQCLSFGFQGVSRNITVARMDDLWAIATAEPKLSTIAGVMATTGERIHVMQRPDQRNLIGNGLEERGVVGKKRDPMQVHDIGVDLWPVEASRMGQLRHRKRLDVAVTESEMGIELSVDFLLIPALQPFLDCPTQQAGLRWNKLDFLVTRIGLESLLVSVIAKRALDSVIQQLTVNSSRRRRRTTVGKGVEMANFHGRKGSVFFSFRFLSFVFSLRRCFTVG